MKEVIKSMTGFGRAAFENEWIKVQCEIKALNGRYFEADIRLPRFLNELDPALRRLLGEKLERGTITCSYNIKLLDPQNAQQELQVNQALAKRSLETLTSLSDFLGVEFKDPFREILKVPEVITTAEREISPEIKDKIIEVTLQAAEQLNSFRAVEGKATGDKLRSLVEEISLELMAIEQHEGNRRESLKERVYGNVLEHVSENLVDMNRLEQELLIYLDKWDIAEEKQRLGQHLTYFIDTLNKEPKGRKLNFIAQEMGREMNTLGVKSNFFPMQQCAVQMKEKLEQIKEQVMNIV